jgi:hypothetical protein
MPLLPSARHSGARTLGIITLILGLVHTPLPQPDFHNIRHHDGPGEVCEHHDHLLRWHPQAGVAANVAVLHWHWFLPSADPFSPSPEDPLPAIHAHVVDWQAPTWDDGPRVSADTASRPFSPIESPSCLPLLILPAEAVAASPVPGPRRAHTFGATFAPHTPLTCLLQRWLC